MVVTDQSSQARAAIMIALTGLLYTVKRSKLLAILDCIEANAEHERARASERGNVIPFAAAVRGWTLAELATADAMMVEAAEAVRAAVRELRAQMELLQ